VGGGGGGGDVGVRGGRREGVLAEERGIRWGGEGVGA
jgi:hypothetical protein